ncbi:sarcosine oxidase subunit gamma family protein [Aurantimonas sp. Leaf443]|uniref:sarcosine oxidase subunit gamma n=1 Tax=Aurantimonas sp. Leaf443 TaxID=1736378 RepID=UPI0006FC1120|nr:sarcosine oxidase subunit gamma family protein [Aurantimonas sp. Leaf443]KQT87483.1 hypothetical protein ASG48_16965 [Aurantimonas sp. Leaf443]
MLEFNLLRRTSAVVPLPETPGASVGVTPLPPEGRLSFRARAKALAGRADVAGFPLSGAMNTRTLAGERAALKVGPDEWVLVCPAGECEEAMEAVAAAMGGAPHSLVDVSHRDVSFEVAGPDAAAVVNAGCPIDLSPAAFPVGSATRTLLGKSDIVLARTGADTFRITAWRSFAPYVQAFLADAARDFGPGHVRD